MGFQVSPGVITTEVDLTTIVPSVSTTEGGVAGVFNWGPVEEAKLVSNENELADQFGNPDSSNFETFFTGANFLAYGNKLYVSRAADANAFNARVGNGAIANLQIKNDTHFTNIESSLDANAYYYAKYPGELGNSLKISVCDSQAAFSSILASDDANVTIAITSNVGSTSLSVTATEAGGNVTISESSLNNLVDDVIVGDYIEVGNTTIGTQRLKVSTIGSVSSNSTVSSVTFTTNKYSLSSNITNPTATRYWEFHTSVESAPTTTQYVSDRGGVGDELHVVVSDEDGLFKGTPGAVLEVFSNLSRATDSLGEQGGTNYYQTVLNNSSKYVYAANDRGGSPSNTAVNMTTLTTTPLTTSFADGTDSLNESSIATTFLAKAYDVYKSAEDIDVSVLLAGKAVNGTGGEAVANYIIDNIAEIRKDLVVCISPQHSDVVNNPYQETTATLTFRNRLPSTNYAILDSGYKLQYDKYNDVNRWIPLNGDIGGLIVRTDDLRDPWWSPAGFNRGGIKNIIKLAYNPNKAQRDQLYPSNINPVVTFKNEGTILYGDKTLQTKPSAFDRINVRRLFIVLEKSISTASKYTLFEFNDDFTRSSFRNMVEPYLRDVQGRRGITDWRVVCDETNNTPEVIDRNEFIGDIYIKPARSISYINLRFVAVRTGVEFDEVVGKFG